MQNPLIRKVFSMIFMWLDPKLVTSIGPEQVIGAKELQEKNVLAAEDLKRGKERLDKKLCLLEKLMSDEVVVSFSSIHA